MMGIVIALGFGAAFFLVSNGFMDPVSSPAELSKTGTQNAAADSGNNAPGKNSAQAYEQMFANIEANIDANPADRGQAYKYGIALIGLGELSRAEEFYRKQLDLYAHDYKIANGLGWCFEKQKKWSEAAEAYETDIRLNPLDTESRNNLAWLLATSPEPSVRNGVKAIALATQAIGNKRPPDPKLMDSLAAAYAEVGSFENAVRIQRYVSTKTDGEHTGIEERLKLYLENKPYRMAK